MKIYGIDESILASGYPMRTKIPNTLCQKDMDRMIKLSSCKPNTGHDTALKGIIVQMDVTAPQHVWIQILRYHFLDVVSSQSKMHKILEMDIDKDDIDPMIAYRFKELTQLYKDGIIDFDFLMNNCPCGITLTARVTTNYLQLKTIHLQRKNHKLKWWRDFCKEVEHMPLFTQLILNKGDN